MLLGVRTLSLFFNSVGFSLRLKLRAALYSKTRKRWRRSSQYGTGGRSASALRDDQGNFIRALALGLQRPVAKATILSWLLRWTEVQLPLLKQRAPTGKAFSSTGNPVYPEKRRAPPQVTICKQSRFLANSAPPGLLCSHFLRDVEVRKSG